MGPRAAAGSLESHSQGSVQAAFTQLRLRLDRPAKLELLRVFITIRGSDGEMHPNHAAMP